MFSLAPMCFLASPYQYQWVSMCAHQQCKHFYTQKGLPVDRHWGSTGYKGIGFLDTESNKAEESQVRVKFKASLIKIQSNQNLSHNCIFEEDWTEEIPRGGPSLHLTFWALHSSFPACPTSRRGFLYVSISCPVRPRWHPQKTVHSICLLSLF